MIPRIQIRSKDRNAKTGLTHETRFALSALGALIEAKNPAKRKPDTRNMATPLVSSLRKSPTARPSANPPNNNGGPNQNGTASTAPKDKINPQRIMPIEFQSIA